MDEMKYELTQAPAREPVDSATVKLELRLGDEFDAMLPRLIRQARHLAEHKTGRALITQKWRAVGEGWPCDGDVDLIRPPFVSVDSVRYYDASNTLRTLDPSQYVADLVGIDGCVEPAFGCVWPVTYPRPGAVMVDFTCGYGDTSASVPEPIVGWIIARVDAHLENYHGGVDARDMVAENPFLDGLLDPYRVLCA